MGCLPFGKKKKWNVRNSIPFFGYLWRGHSIHILVSILSHIAVATVHFFIRKQPLVFVFVRDLLGTTRHLWDQSFLFLL